jgi:hypothetical protein
VIPPRQLALPKFIITTPITSVERVYLPLLLNGPIHIGANCSMSQDMILLDWCDTGKLVSPLWNPNAMGKSPLEKRID